MSVTEQNRPIPSDEDDVVFTLTLADILAFLRRSRRAMLVGALIGGLLGALYAFSKPNEYTSSVTLLPEIQAKSGGNMGGLSSLAGLAGIDINGLGGNADAVRPELYPTVLQSVPFALAIAKQPVYSKEFKKTQSLEAYLEDKSKPGWFGRLFATTPDSTGIAIAGPNVGALELTKKQDELTKGILIRVAGTYDKKSGVLTISTIMPDPIVAAATTQQALAYLTNYVTSYRTEKARLEVDFLIKQVATAKKRYQQAEYALSTYRDQNRSVFLNTAKIEEQRIQAEFLLAQELYNALSKQSEMAKIKVQQDTPVFKILEPAQVPLKKSAPKRTIIMVVGVILGLFVSFIYKGWSLYQSRPA